MLYKSSSYDPKINGYPTAVFDLNGGTLGTAADAYEYADLWNNSLVNKKAGRIYPQTALLFTMVSSGLGCCCEETVPVVPGCGGAPGDTPAPGGVLGAANGLHLTADKKVYLGGLILEETHLYVPGGDVLVFKTDGLIQLPNLATGEDALLGVDSEGNLITMPASSIGTAGWGLEGNADTDPTLNYVGTSDAQPFVIRTNDTVRFTFDHTFQRILTGKDSFIVNGGSDSVDESNNIIINSSISGTSGTILGASNVIMGNSPASNTTAAAHDCVIMGTGAGANVAAPYNICIGINAGKNVRTKYANIAIGVNALGDDDAAYLMDDNNIGNIAIGQFALGKLRAGMTNIVVGQECCTNAVNMGGCIVMGYDNLVNLNTGSGNKTIGSTIGNGLVTGINNIGYGSGITWVGTASYNIGIGDSLAWGNMTKDRNIQIGHAHQNINQSYSITIGESIAVYVPNGDGQLNIGNILYGKGLQAYIGAPISTPTATGSIGIGVRDISARLHLPANDIAPGMAALKFQPGNLLTTPENGAVEYNGDHIYLTSGGTRWQLDRQGDRLRPTGGTAAIDGSPLKFTAGTFTTTPENGSMEYDGNQIYYTTNGTRKVLGEQKTGIAFNAMNGAGPITTGIKKRIVIPYDCTIVGWSIVGDQVGSVIVDVWVKANGIPTAADSICGTQKPTLTTASQFVISNNVSSWTTLVPANSVMIFNIDSATALTDISLVLKII